MNEIVEEVVKRIQQQQQNTFEVEASGRHVHLSRQEIDALFGPGYQLHHQRLTDVCLPNCASQSGRHTSVNL